ncbi:putative nucleotide kinase [Encephalitozoon intestinalis ATCC 50506]|uniref:Adenylate kinase isoenzyme 6 homolog n=1 Tax=Encephalitozoon intestinalis (strain ATCC 50506) TaxID=876142 RepID=E0S9N1_ENCIT|nr:putative nucleotide kinase [Encephalitozoon intestinalis ATCC 50506]ADM12416.1 putative nucleotide kinase [Encephalitozoon intestinalis ATCC 50506]UTX46250.1 coilin-interacting nuclear ATPase protein [Encephalitozoon intestinalis]
MKILVTGTPGVGKTTFSLDISKRFGIPHVEMSRYIEENNLYEEYSETYKSLLFDDEVVRKSLEGYLLGKESYIIDTHSCGMAANIAFDLVFLMKAPVEVLYKRLKERGYDEDKIKENIECEIFGVVEEEVEGLFGDNYHTIGEEEGGLTSEEAMCIISKKIGPESSVDIP